MSLSSLWIGLFILVTSTFQEHARRYVYRTDYRHLSAHGALYKVHGAKANFSGAIAACTAEGAELLVPTSSAETMDVFALAGERVTLMWIGVHDLYSEGEFVTLNGEELEGVYSNWRKGEPNNNKGDEDCATVSRDTTYNDVSCTRKYHFACKRSTADLKPNDRCQNYDQGFKFNADLGACYKLSESPAKWSDAFKMCKVLDSHLAIINGVAEAHYLAKELSKRPKGANGDRAFVGFSDVLDIGVYKTVDGKNLTASGYTNWAKGQPSHRGKDYCGAMTREGTLAVFNCTRTVPYFCEKRVLNVEIDVRFERRK